MPDDGLQRLDELTTVMHQLPTLIEEAIIRPLDDGAIWEQIGEAFHDVSKQAAWYRFRYLEKDR